MIRKIIKIIVIIIIFVAVLYLVIYLIGPREEFMSLNNKESKIDDSDDSKAFIEKGTLEKVNEVELGIDAPFSMATLTIDNGGNINYEALAPDIGMARQVDSSRITAEQYNDLMNLINNNNIFSFENSYIEEDLMDATTYTLTIKKDGQEKSIICYGECPKEIVEIINKVKELWGKEILEIDLTEY